VDPVDPNVAAVSEDACAHNGFHAAALDRKARRPLNARETEVLRLVGQGLANKEIAAKMNILESGVKKPSTVVWED
jgi:DNA-binding NarL/FixJ family response regulator